jgi:hypothetical protein
MYSVSRMLNVRVYGFQDPSCFCRFTMTCSDELLVPSAHGRCRNQSVIVQLVCHHPHRQLFTKFQRRHRDFLLRTPPSLHCIHLCDRQKESELSVLPPFCCPNIFQTNLIVTTIVNVINPVLARLCRLNGSAYLNVLHTPSMSRHAGWS